MDHLQLGERRVREPLAEEETVTQPLWDDGAYRQRLANGIASAIRTQAAIGDAGTGPLPRPINAPPSRA